jgi:Na+/phosphate symporter
MTIIFPVLVMVVGLFAYFASNKSETKECGRIAFFIGLFVVTFRVVNETFSILR